MEKDREFHTVRGYQMLNSENKLLTSSMEDYLEMIYRVCIKEGYIRINQLAHKLNVRPSSTTKVVKKLNVMGLVDYQRYGIVQLTENGKEVGRFLLKRHRIIEEFLKNLGVEKTLLKDTEMIEHDVSINTLKKIYMLNEFLYNNPDVIKRFKNFKKEFYKENQEMLK
ncbi:metal-dependent transcriptional regulator [Maledivibacter halophilus]|uniref:Iron (Metal) dependent repressor, DtxR family n=1 Tax=Maledivibacter halophilus TaxID=36842 RepID=A0A1T5KMY9_9FIRM|nr:iron dependent repressor, metal binding and dimerization domain protein [Maledivibacter halophilus]SKC65067.1 iron (metal) dependent repressor, DtxR family [Maledivibacter halophilus]